MLRKYPPDSRTAMLRRSPGTPRTVTRRARLGRLGELDGRADTPGQALQENRGALKHRRQFLDSIPAHLPEKKLDAELYRIDHSYQAELQGRYHELLAANDPKTMQHADYEESPSPSTRHSPLPCGSGRQAVRFRAESKDNGRARA